MERSCVIYKLRRKAQVLASKVLPDKLLSKFYCSVVLKKKVDLDSPKTFNEKIQWCKLNYYPKDALVVQCADKYAVRSYVEKKGFKQLLVPLYGVWEKADEIPVDDLPDQFILKCTHGCAYNILCPDKSKLDWVDVKKQLDCWLKEDFGAFNLERHYSRIKPRRIVCEEFLGECITDYKFFCFNGVPKCIYVSTDLVHDRQAQIGFFDLEGRKMPLRRDDYTDITEVTLPPFFQEMQAAAAILCEDFPFVRVDFFVTEDRFYFAELTFTPGAGMIPFNPEEYDHIWGNQLDIRELVEKYGA